MTDIQDDSLDLIPATAEFLELLVAKEHSRAGDLINVVVPDGWPNDPEATAGLSWHLKAIHEDPNELLWRIRLIVWRSTRTVIGSINLKGAPDESGTVEIGWGISQEFRHQGIATKAARAVIEWVFSQPGVKRIVATIPPENIASVQVAKRLGMRQTEQLRRGLPVWAMEELGESEEA